MKTIQNNEKASILVDTVLALMIFSILFFTANTTAQILSQQIQRQEQRIFTSIQEKNQENTKLYETFLIE